MTENIEEKSLTYDEFVNAVGIGESLRIYKPERKLERIPISICIKEAESLGISKEYFLKGVEMFDPPIEKQIEDIKKYNMTPSILGISKMYSRNIMIKLKKNFPCYEFIKEFSNEFHPFIKFIQVLKTKEKEKFLFMKKENTIENHKQWGYLDFSSEACGLAPMGKFNLKINVKEPNFIHSCGEIIEKISNYFKEKEMLNLFRINYDYNEHMEEIEFND